MKKARIMLMSIAVLATVAGALAFNANNKFNGQFCTRELADGPGQCEAFIQNAKTNPVTPEVTFYYTTSTDECDVLQCPKSTSFEADGAN